MRQIDLRCKTLSRSTLRDLFSRLYAEISLAASYPVGSGVFPRFGAGHLGAEINTAIDGVDAAIATGATMLGKSAPANGTRSYDFTTGSHDVTRLHVELDRLHGRIDALGKASMNGAILPPFPYTLHRTGSASHITMAGAFATAGDCAARFGLPYVVRRNLLSDSGIYSSGYTITGAASLSGSNLTATALDAGIYREYTISGATTGRTYTLSWLVSGSGNAYVQINGRGGASGDEYIQGTKTTLTGGTQVLTASITLTANDRTSLRVYLRNGAASTTTCAMNGTQIDLGAVTTYQPTNSSGVDLSNSLNGAGIVLEGVGTNLCPNNTWSTAVTPWVASTQGNLTRTTSLISGKTYALQYPFGAQYQVVYFPVTLAASTTYTVSFKGVYDAGKYLWLQDISNNNTLYTWNSTGNTDDITFTFTTGATPPTSLGLKCPAASGWGTVKIDAMQVEAGAFKTSLILTDGAATTRNLEQCAVVEPQQLLIYPGDFSKAAWFKLGVTSTSELDPNDHPTAALLDTSVAGANIAQDIPIAWDTDKNTASVSLKANVAGTPILLRLLRSDTSAVIGTATIALTTSYQRYSVTGTGTGGGNIKLVIQRPGTQTGLVSVAWPLVNRGSIPGPYIATQDTPILPSGITTDPAYWQNGSVEFDVTASGTPQSKAVFGADLLSSENQKLSLLHSASTLNRAVFCRKTSDGTSRQLVQNSSPIFNGTQHRIRLEWRNYIATDPLTGLPRRYMPMTIYVDENDGQGLLARATQDVASLYGANAWIAPERLWLSDGNTFATLSNITPSYLPIPAGATL